MRTEFGRGPQRADGRAYDRAMSTVVPRKFLRLGFGSLAGPLGLAWVLMPSIGCDGASPSQSQWWYRTCGDPVCESYTGPTDGVALCTDQIEGAECEVEGATCDPEDSCNAFLLCTPDDPTQAEGGCPISRKKYKTDIHYLDSAERNAAAKALLSTRLATWRYRWDAPTAPPHFGFMIDDQEGSAAVAPDGEHVNLYGYNSMTVAAIQMQQTQLDLQAAAIAAQAAEIAVLRGELAAIRGR